MRFLFSSLLVLLVAACAGAKVKVPAIFSDHMVLQADAPVPVWGTADAGEKIAVRIGEQSKSAVAGADGHWRITLDPLKPADALTLQIEGTNKLTINDVLVGEVWLCSGQSNMVLPVSKAAKFDQEKPAANYPKIRTFTTKWVTCSPETVGSFSAVAYFFGREVHQKTGLGVGLINRAAGGSPIEWWTSRAAQDAVPELKALAASAPSAQQESDRQQAVEVEGKNAAATQPKTPGSLFEDRIVPLIPYSIRGVVWYQGEANSYTENAPLYGKQLATMIADWRKRWGYDFAFISVQLPEFGKAQVDPVEDGGRVAVREGVLRSLDLPNTGIAVTLGTGEANNNHPTDKQTVGARLAAWALANVYKQDVASSGPLLKSHRVDGSKIVLTFTHADKGLVAHGGGALKGFAICGADGKWAFADATIDRDTVIVSSASVKTPVSVRYAWATNPQGANLYNGAGLPASPFRTDP